MASDSSAYPYAQDLDGMWHRRPAGDEWTNFDIRAHGADQPQFHSMCGKALPSVRVADSAPDPDDLLDGETICSCAATEGAN